MQQSTPVSAAPVCISVIYALCDSSDNVRYIGVTSKSLAARLREHISEAARGDQSHRCKWIRSLKVPPTTIEIEQTTDRAREIYWIAKFRADGFRLTNGTNGGDGVVGLRHGPETRARIAARLKERFPEGRKGPNSGKHHTDEAKRKMSIAHKARIAVYGVRPVSDETRAKLSASSKQQVRRTVSAETREKLRIFQSARREREKAQPGGIQNPYKGVPRTEETKAKMREAWARRRDKQAYKNGNAQGTLDL